ncbi:hypothetical protein COLU111180_00605 [Cohnella lubricantis]|uniref:Uncharacterized protein n=1 Tax=Cohnella lubricantis TaxID=2163172 RepID=A0A841T5E1_9BACL|nr:hypothetical protein [Cohnella lubricantis]MBB6676534.1 hypothetical protein [Cohnella lubricantis]MBP2120527.1 hypothetical protein [Cohnella lubricantis]
MRKQSLKKSLLSVLTIVAVSTSLTGVASAASNDTSTPTPFVSGFTANTTFVSANDALTDVTTISSDVPIESYTVKEITAEEFAQRTGRSLAQLEPKTLTKASTATYQYREYGFSISLGGNITARAGVLVQLEQLMMGASVVYRINFNDTDSAYISPGSGGHFQIYKNYASSIPESDTQFVFAVSGYAETAVVEEFSTETGLTIGELVNIGWSYSSTSSSTTYYRKNFSASARFTV